MIIIGVDQSYTDTGISVIINEIPVKYISLDFKGCKNKSQKRNKLRNILEKIILKCKEKDTDIKIICERIRTFTGGNSLRPNYLKSVGALIATIVDIGEIYNIKTYSVDTRAWMAQIIGSSKSIKKKDNKYKSGVYKPSVKYVYQKYGINVKYMTPRGLKKYNDNISDVICIGLYGFCKNQKLKLEE